MRAFWTTADLLALGRSPREIRRAVEQERLVIVRRGLLAGPGTSPPLLRAARVGGVATSVTAAAARGLWTAPDPPSRADAAGAGRPAQDRLHVDFRSTTRRLHDPDDGADPLRRHPAVVTHRTPSREVDTGFATGIAPTMTMLEHVFRSVPAEHVLAVLDSALHHRFLRPADARRSPLAFPRGCDRSSRRPTAGPTRASRRSRGSSSVCSDCTSSCTRSSRGSARSTCSWKDV